MHRPGLVLLALCFTSHLAFAQYTAPVPMPESYRALQLRELEVQRKLFLAMADSMPESLYGDRATPIQRDFASQVMHAAEGPSLVAAEYLGGSQPQLPDSTASHNTRAGLKAFINASYDYGAKLLANESADSRAALFKFWNGEMIPRWQLWDELNQHAIWTAGQIVANFRKNGMAPPAFSFF
jgi:hypothetical protein